MKPLESLFRSFVETDAKGAARALEALESGEAARILRSLPPTAVGSVLRHLMPQAAGPMLDSMEPEAVRSLLKGLSPRASATLLHHASREKRKTILDSLAPKEAARIRALLEYAPETAGSMMSTQVTSIPSDATVGQAVRILRKAERQTLFYLYVTDRSGKLVGVVNMRDLLLASTRDPVDPLVRREITRVTASTSREELSQIFQEKKYLALPVVDEEDHLLGAVRHDQLVRAVQEEAFGDFQKMVGAGREERALSPVSTVVGKRLPWLIVNLFTAFIAAAVVGMFDSIIAQVTALAVLLPVVAGQGGNTGSQALAVVMRGMALKEIAPGSVRRLLIKEFMGALINGIGIAILTAGAVLLWKPETPALALVIGLAMIVNMAAAGFSGAVIPLILKKMGRDPAQSSSIFLTTVTDVVGFAAFLGFAVLFRPLLIAA